MTLRRLFFVAAAGLFASLAVMLGLFFYDAREEYLRLRSIESEDARRLAEAEARLQAQEIVLDRLRHDPSYVERVIRRDLGYARPNEYLFRFEDAPNGP